MADNDEKVPVCRVRVRALVNMSWNDGQTCGVVLAGMEGSVQHVNKPKRIACEQTFAPLPKTLYVWWDACIMSPDEDNADTIVTAWEDPEVPITSVQFIALQ